MANKEKRVIVKVTSEGLAPVLKDLKQIHTLTKGVKKVKFEVNRTHLKSSMSQALASLNKVGGLRTLTVKALVNKKLFRNSLASQISLIEKRGINLNARIAGTSTNTRRERESDDRTSRMARVASAGLQGSTTAGIAQANEAYVGMQKVFSEQQVTAKSSNRQMNMLNSNMEMVARAIADLVGVIVSPAAKARILKQAASSKFGRNQIHGTKDGYALNGATATREEYSIARNQDPSYAKAKSASEKLEASKGVHTSPTQSAFESLTRALLKNTLAVERSTATRAKAGTSIRVRDPAPEFETSAPSRPRGSRGSGGSGGSGGFGGSGGSGGEVATARTNRAVAGITNRQGKAFSAMASSSGGLAGMYAAIAAQLFAVGAAYRALRDSADMTVLNQSMQEYGNITGSNLRGVTKGLQEAMGMAIDYKQAAQSTMLATAAGFGKESILAMGEAAKLSGQALGRNMGDALDRITKGIIKQEPELLDELGIILRLEDASLKYADAMGISGRKLTTYEKSQAVLVDTLGQVKLKFGALKGLVDTNPWDLLAARITEVGRVMGETINTVAGPAVKAISESPTLLTLAFTGLVSYLTSKAIPALLGTATAADKLAELQNQVADNRPEAEALGKRGRGRAWEAFNRNKSVTGSTREAQTARESQAFADMRVRNNFEMLDAETTYYSSVQDYRLGWKEQLSAMRTAGRDYYDGQISNLNAATQASGASTKGFRRLSVAWHKTAAAGKALALSAKLLGAALLAAVPYIGMIIAGITMLVDGLEWMAEAIGITAASNDALDSSLVKLGEELDNQSIKQENYRSFLLGTTGTLEEYGTAAERAANRQMALADSLAEPLKELTLFNKNASSFDLYWDDDKYDNASKSLKKLAKQLIATGKLNAFESSTEASEAGVNISDLVAPDNKGTKALEATMTVVEAFFKSQAAAAKNFQSNLKDLSSSFKELGKATKTFLTSEIPSTPFDKLVDTLKEVSGLLDTVLLKSTGMFDTMDTEASLGNTRKLFKSFSSIKEEQSLSIWEKLFIDKEDNSSAMIEKMLQEDVFSKLSDSNIANFNEQGFQQPVLGRHFGTTPLDDPSRFEPATLERLKESASLYSGRDFKDISNEGFKEQFVYLVGQVMTSDALQNATKDAWSLLAKAGLDAYGKTLVDKGDQTNSEYVVAVTKALQADFERAQANTISSKARQTQLKSESKLYKDIEGSVRSQVISVLYSNKALDEQINLIDDKALRTKEMLKGDEHKVKREAQLTSLATQRLKLENEMQSTKVAAANEYVKNLEKELKLQNEVLEATKGYLETLSSLGGLNKVQMATLSHEVEKRTALNDLNLRHTNLLKDRVSLQAKARKTSLITDAQAIKQVNLEIKSVETLLNLETSRMALKGKSSVIEAQLDVLGQELELHNKGNDALSLKNNLLLKAGLVSQTSAESAAAKFEAEKRVNEYNLKNFELGQSILALEAESSRLTNLKTVEATALAVVLDANKEILEKEQTLRTNVHDTVVLIKEVETKVNKVLKERIQTISAYDNLYEAQLASVELKLELTKGYAKVAASTLKKELVGAQAAWKLAKLKQAAVEIQAREAEGAFEVALKMQSLENNRVKQANVRLELQKEYVEWLKEEHELSKGAFKNAGLFSNPAEFGRLFSNEMHYRFEEFNDTFRDNVTFAADLWETAFLDPIDRMADNLKKDEGIYGAGGYDEFWNETWRGLGDEFIDQGAAEIKSAMMSDKQKDKLAEANNLVIENMRLGNLPLLEEVKTGNSILSVIQSSLSTGLIGPSEKGTPSGELFSTGLKELIAPLELLSPVLKDFKSNTAHFNKAISEFTSATIPKLERAIESFGAYVTKFVAGLGSTIIPHPSAGRDSYATNAVLAPRERATGGSITGPGGPKEDKIPAMLSNGEFVINAASTGKHRALIEAINEDKLPGFAKGTPSSIPESATQMDIERSAVSLMKKFPDKYPPEIWGFAKGIGQKNIHSWPTLWPDSWNDLSDESSKPDWLKKLGQFTGNLMYQRSQEYERADGAMNMWGAFGSVDRYEGGNTYFPIGNSGEVFSRTWNKEKYEKYIKEHGTISRDGRTTPNGFIYDEESGIPFHKLYSLDDNNNPVDSKGRGPGRRAWEDASEQSAGYNWAVDNNILAPTSGRDLLDKAVQGYNQSFGTSFEDGGLASLGRNGDSELAHINKDEQALLKSLGGSGTINPKTGLSEYNGGSSVSAEKEFSALSKAIEKLTSMLATLLKSTKEQTTGGVETSLPTNKGKVLEGVVDRFGPGKDNEYGLNEAQLLEIVSQYLTANAEIIGSKVYELVDPLTETGERTRDFIIDELGVLRDDILNASTAAGEEAKQIANDAKTQFELALAKYDLSLEQAKVFGSDIVKVKGILGDQIIEAEETKDLNSAQKEHLQSILTTLQSQAEERMGLQLAAEQNGRSDEDAQRYVDANASNGTAFLASQQSAREADNREKERIWHMNNSEWGKITAAFGIEMSEIHTLAAGSMKMALGEALRTGKFEWKTMLGSFAMSIGNKLISAGTDAVVEYGLDAAADFFFANGGVAEGGFRAFANGGMVTKPTLGLVGEGKYNEAVVPLPDGKSIPVIQNTPLNGAGNTVNNVIVTVNMEQGTARKEGSSGSGGGSGFDLEKLGEQVASQVQQVLQDEKRPGGLLSEI